MNKNEPQTPSQRVRVLWVCWGNISRVDEKVLISRIFRE